MGDLELHIAGLDGSELHLTVADSLTGRQLLQLLRSKLPPRHGAKVVEVRVAGGVKRSARFKQRLVHLAWMLGLLTFCQLMGFPSSR